jgi:hypothetical protein
MLNSSLKQLGAALRARKISSVELTQLYLDRVANLNPALNAYITVNPELSLAQARAADALLAGGKAQASTCSSVVLPAPDGPITAICSPAATCNDRLRSAAPASRCAAG